MAALYYVYLNTMVFAIISGIVSMLLLLALIYVPAVSQYGILILTVQIGLMAIVVQAIVRIWWNWSKSLASSDLSIKNTLAVGSCPDYMIAGANATNLGGGTVCTNQYPKVGTTSPPAVWNGTTATPAPVTVNLSALNNKPIADVCKAINDPTATPALLAQGSTATVPWTELRSRCTSFPSS